MGGLKRWTSAKEMKEGCQKRKESVGRSELDQEGHNREEWVNKIEVIGWREGWMDGG